MNESLGVLDKALAMLELLSQADQPLGPTQIASALDMNKATVYRILQNLCKRGYANKNSKGQYTCGAKLIEIASNHIGTLELQTEAKPYLVMLYSELGMSVHLGVLDGGSTVFVEKIDLYSGRVQYAQVGYRTPSHCSSIGKCLLASLSGDQLDEVLYGYEFKAYTSNTITSMKQFKEHLRIVRSQGWAIDNEEYLIGSCCVGAPVYDYRGDVIACISISGTKIQFSDERKDFLVGKVVETANQISKRMGYTNF